MVAKQALRMVYHSSVQLALGTQKTCSSYYYMSLRVSRRAALLGLLAIGASAPAAAQRSRTPSPADPAVVARLAGCYALTVNPWIKPIRSGPAVAPSTIRLDTLFRAPGQRGYRYVAQIPGGAGASWTPVGADSLEVITWLAQFEAEVLFLRSDGDSLRGMARRTTDAIPVDANRQIRWDVWPAAPVVARPTSCSNHAREPHQ
jgi:hypothetical protein